jgi:FtsP/CotA-like multicopper oxidase with cupredoxin domain
MRIMDMRLVLGVLFSGASLCALGGDSQGVIVICRGERGALAQSAESIEAPAAQLPRPQNEPILHHAGTLAATAAQLPETNAQAPPPVTSSSVRTCEGDQVTFGQPLCDPGVRLVATPPGSPPFDLTSGASLISMRCQPPAVCPAKLGSPLKFVAYTYDSQLAPAVWSIPHNAADPTAALGTIHFRLINNLPPQSGDNSGKPQPTNIHVHGMLVSPRDAAKPEQGHGDNVFIALCPNQDMSKGGTPLGTDVCLNPNSGIDHNHLLEIHASNYAIPIPADHVPGLNWFHPHAHGVSAAQVGAGLSGLIAVGDLCSYPLEAAVRAEICETREGISVLRANIRERFMMLKDLQVTYADPKKIGSGATAEGYTVATSCLGTARSYGFGWCEFARNDAIDRKPASNAPAADGLWAFTVNGQVSPVVRMAGGSFEIWRIGNISPNFVYRLALCKAPPTRDPSVPKAQVPPKWRNAEAAYNDLNTCDRQPFQIVSVDGGGGWNQQFQATGSELLLMPGSRAEILVNTPTSGRLFFAHLGFKQPDTWPATVLATVESDGTTPSSSPPSFAMNMEQANLYAQVNVDPSKPVIRPLGCTDANTIDGNGIVTVVFEPKQKDDPKAKKTEILVLRTWPNYDITQDPSFRLCADSTKNNNANDGLASGAVRRQCQPFVGTEFQPGRKDLCVRIGSTVKFRLINATSEIHNFHLHQTKFTVTQFTSAPITGNSSFDVVNQATQQRMSGSSAAQFKNIDSIPVLPTQVAADGTVTRMVDLNVRFDRPEQVGSFVFHCHILEHEDEGMMNTITIFD